MRAVQAFPMALAFQVPALANNSKKWAVQTHRDLMDSAPVSGANSAKATGKWFNLPINREKRRHQWLLMSR